MNVILVIEDAQDNYDLIEDLLEGRHKLVHASAGPDGLALAREVRPNLILLDMGLPGMDGWTVARRLKSDEETRSIPVIALTAHAMTGDREKSLASGCDEYMAKPIDLCQLTAVIDRFLDASTVRPI